MLLAPHSHGLRAHHQEEGLSASQVAAHMRDMSAAVRRDAEHSAFCPTSHTRAHVNGRNEVILRLPTDWRGEALQAPVG